MKKTLSVLMISLLVLSISTKAQMTYVQGGINLANITKTNSGETQKNNILPTFNVGVMHWFSLGAPVAIETGVLFTGRGSKAETYFNGGNDYVKSKFNPLYIEVPLNLIVKIPIGTGSKLFLNAGPYAAVGVAGKSKTETKVLSVVSTSEKNIDFNDDDPFTSEQENAGYNKLKRFDFGLNFGGGLAFKHVLLKVNYGLGLAKINSTESNNDSNDKNKYRTLSVSLGIPFGGR